MRTRRWLLHPIGVTVRIILQVKIVESTLIAM